MRRPCLPSLRAAIGIALAALAGSAWAHDTWFAPVAATKPGEIQLMLGTGNQYPIQESALAFEHVEKTGCRAADGKAVTMASVSARRAERSCMVRKPGLSFRSCRPAASRILSQWPSVPVWMAMNPSLAG